MRILHAIHDFLPRHRAGSEIYCLELCRALAGRGHHVHVLAAEYEPSRADRALLWREEEGVPVTGLNNLWRFAGAKIAQDRNELIVEALGHSGLGWDGDGFQGPELAAVRTWLRSKGNSIEGGTSEINLNVVSKRVLGLPDPK